MGILQAPLFSPQNVAAANYGSLGMIVGHELTHAFDSIGKKLNENGVKDTWWSDDSNTAFMENAQCFVNQYGHAKVPLSTGEIVDVDGHHTLSENIADNGGLHMAYMAWIKHMKEQGKTQEEIESLPVPEYGLNGEEITMEKLFFISFAQTWCGVPSDAQISGMVAHDPHAPSSVRVNGVVRNNPVFHKAFGCPMPEKTCSLY